MTVRETTAALVGRTFVHPSFDYLVIGGGLSVVLALWMSASEMPVASELAPFLPQLLIVSNGAHFAASTARLYSRPGAWGQWPFLTLGLPLASLALLGLGAWFAATVGPHLYALYLTWSPFHYAAQAYGLALMYCYRSGSPLSDRERRVLRAACLFPFVRAFITGPTSGMAWLLPGLASTSDPAWTATIARATWLLELLTWLAPVLLLAAHWIRVRRPMPLIAPLIVLTNGVWWIVLGTWLDAFVWATVFHGLQYLAIVILFHVCERPDPRVVRVRRGIAFYGICVAGGYALFHLWPHALRASGFGAVESALLVGAVVNIHHFVVDAYVWRLRQPANAAIVRAATAPVTA